MSTNSLDIDPGIPLEVVVWAFTRSNVGVRHIVDRLAVLPEGQTGQLTLCKEGAWQLHPRTPQPVGSFWVKARVCPACLPIAVQRLMVVWDCWGMNGGER